MVAAGQLYAAIVILLLLVALGISIPVLKRILLEGIERRRKLQAGEIERYTEDEEYDRIHNAALDEGEATHLLCRQCGAENELGFTYCRRCAAPL